MDHSPGERPASGRPDLASENLQRLAKDGYRAVTYREFRRASFALQVSVEILQLYCWWYLYLYLSRSPPFGFAERTSEKSQ